MTTLPKYFQVRYNRTKGGIFELDAVHREKAILDVLPKFIRREPAKAVQIKRNVIELLTGSQFAMSNRWTLLSGLQRGPFRGWFVGNLFAGTKRGLLLFRFADNGELLTVFYFPAFDKRTASERLDWSMFAIPQLYVENNQTTRPKPWPPERNLFCVIGHGHQ